ncbi:hypothetical protein AYI68_g6315 [Smittium mucronatum]|uniref:Uncharacterized protein n=1 Tax=Smittium mucronatum TaxID=133383 RepID=A0A1R0GRV3_9FUNG|nr:hypothetical protein AYI68_g6315 [Smittium mucronatum]
MNHPKPSQTSFENRLNVFLQRKDTDRDRTKTSNFAKLNLINFSQSQNSPAKRRTPYNSESSTFGQYIKKSAFSSQNNQIKTQFFNPPSSESISKKSINTFQTIKLKSIKDSDEIDPILENSKPLINKIPLDKSNLDSSKLLNSNSQLQAGLDCDPVTNPNNDFFPNNPDPHVNTDLTDNPSSLPNSQFVNSGFSDPNFSDYNNDYASFSQDDLIGIFSSNSQADNPNTNRFMELENGFFHYHKPNFRALSLS